MAPAQDNAEAGARLDQADRRPADRLPSPHRLRLPGCFSRFACCDVTLFADLIISPTGPPTPTAPLRRSRSRRDQACQRPPQARPEALSFRVQAQFNAYLAEYGHRET